VLLALAIHVDTMMLKCKLGYVTDVIEFTKT